MGRTGLDALSEEAVRGWFRSDIWQALKFEIKEHIEFLRDQAEIPYRMEGPDDAPVRVLVTSEETALIRGQILAMRNFLDTYAEWEERKDASGSD